MKTKNNPPRTLVWVTLAVIAIVIVATSISAKSNLPQGIPIDTEGQPTIGFPKAPVHVVVFEEPKCVSCKDYSVNIYPKIKEKYIDTNKVKYTTFIVSFLPNSMQAAEAMMCVYNVDPEYPNAELFYAYAEYIYGHQPDERTDWVKNDLLVDYARKTSPAIHLDQLRSCIEKDSYRVRVEKNTQYGQQLMGGRLSTPTVYVNGVEVKELTYQGLSELIDGFLSKAGVY